MIEVIKHGTKKFTATCANCGCEFTYEVEDIHDGKITCPDCGYYVVHQNFGNNNGGLYYPPNCRGVEQVPKTKTIWFNSVTGADEANVKWNLYGAQGDVYTTEKDLEIQQMFKDQMSKKTAIPCVDKE